MLLEKEIFENRNIKGSIFDVYEELGCFMTLVELTEGIAEGGDSGALLFCQENEE